jgi:hypothetical protein
VIDGKRFEFWQLNQLRNDDGMTAQCKHGNQHMMLGATFIRQQLGIDAMARLDWTA